MSAPSAEVLSRAVSGEREAIERLLADWRPDLSRYARRHCHSEDVEDAVQDALLIVATRLSALRALTSFAGWSFRIVKRICRSMLVRASRSAAIDPDALSAPAAQELRVSVSSALSKLPEAQRRALILKDVLGLSAEEMAQALDLPLEAAKARLHRARLRIREDLGDGLR